MSVRETLEIHHPVSVETYLQVLKNEFAVRDNPDESDSFAYGNPPTHFYRPVLKSESRVTFVLGFNKEPLPDVLVLALILHPEIVPKDTMIYWVAEQEIIDGGHLYDLAPRYVRALAARFGEPESEDGYRRAQ
jgi:hypothetical protein